MVVTALVLVLLAVSALDVAGELLAGRRRALVAAGVVLCLATVALLADYRVSRNRLEPDRADNRVVAALRTAGDGAGPVLGVPIMGQAVTWNSSSTYLGAQSRRRVLNAYNQTPAPWQAERVAASTRSTGARPPGALEVLRQTGTRQVVVIDEPPGVRAGRGEATVGGLVAGGVPAGRSGRATRPARAGRLTGQPRRSWSRRSVTQDSYRRVDQRCSTVSRWNSSGLSRAL